MGIESTTTTTGIGSLPATINYPATVNEGDLLVLIAGHRIGVDVSCEQTTPSGWTRRSGADVYDAGDTQGIRRVGAAVYTRVAPAGLGGTTFTLAMGDNTQSPRWFAAVIRATDLAFNVAVSDRREAATVLFPSATTTEDGATLLRAAVHTGDYNAAVVAPSGTSIIGNAGYTNGGYIGVLQETDAQVSAGATGTLTWDYGGDFGHVANTIALAPASVGETGPVIQTGTFVNATAEGFQVRFTTDTAEGTAYYVVYPANLANHTNDEAGAIQVRNGLNSEGNPALASGSMSVTTTGVQTFPTAVTGLNSNTTYKVAVTHRIVVAA